MTDSKARLPAGERLAALEERSLATARDIAELKAQGVQVVAGMQRIENALSQQRGADRIKQVVFGLLQTLGGGVAGAAAARLLAH